jgi:5-formyltetrahydrofolate cyclo-ligase
MTIQLLTKPALRQHIKAQWAVLDWTLFNQQAQSHLSGLILTARNVLRLPEQTTLNGLLYMPLKGELDLNLAVAGLSSSPLVVWLPKVVNNTLHVGVVDAASPAIDNQLSDNQWGIKEPFNSQPLAGTLLSAPWLMCIPCLGLNAQGYRLGRGKGYYDRFLSALPVDSRVVTVGVCPSACAAPNMPGFTPDPWDIPLNGWLSEQGIHWF